MMGYSPRGRKELDMTEHARARTLADMADHKRVTKTGKMWSMCQSTSNHLPKSLSLQEIKIV